MRNFQSISFRTIVTFIGGMIGGFPVSAAEPVSMPQTISVPVYFLNATGEPAPAAAIPGNLTVQLGAISGSLGGGRDVPLLTIRVGPKKDIRLDLADLAAKLGMHAARFSETDGAPLELTPSDVRFARVSTGALSGSDALMGLAVVFWDLEANGSLVPVYCDRPCQLRAPKSGDDFKFDVQSPGLAWMLTMKVQNSRFLHTRAVNPNPVIIIAPPEALDRISPSTLARREL